MGALNGPRFGRHAMSLRLLHEASALRESEPYDVIHCHYGENGIRALHLRKVGALKGRIVTTFYGYDVSSYLLQHGRSAYRELFAEADLCVGISRLMCERLAELGSPRERLVHIPVGIDLSAFRFRAPNPSTGETIRVLSVGRLVEKKGFEVAIKAFALIAGKDQDVNTILLATGPSEVSYRSSSSCTA